MKNVELETAWGIVRHSDCYIPFHSHDYYELVYYRNGKGITHVGETVYEFNGENFILIPPGISHDEKTFISCDVFCVGFRTEEKLALELYEDVQGRIKRIVKAIMEETVSQDLGYREMLKIRLSELLLMMRRLAQKQQKRPQGKNFKYVINYIGENYHEKIQLKNFAAQLNFSYDYFQHKFKEELGVSPQKFLVQKRVEAAKKMLRDEELSCTEIAYRCGFSNSAQFSAVFKREVGVKPQQYRKELKSDAAGTI